MLEPPLEDVDLVQKRRLRIIEAAISDVRLENLIGMWAAVGHQANKPRASACLEDLHIGIEDSRVVPCHDHRAVGVVWLGRLECGSPLARIKPAAKVFVDRQIEGVTVFRNRLEEAGKPSLLDPQCLRSNRRLRALRHR